MTAYTKEEIWDYLLEAEIATEEELCLVTCINGWTVETLESIIYARTAYRSLEQLKAEDEDEEEDD